MTGLLAQTATPAVAAEVVNFLSYVTGDAEFTSIDEYYDALFNHLSEADRGLATLVVRSLMVRTIQPLDTIIAEITTEVEITFDDGSTKTVNVLKQMLLHLLLPDSTAGYRYAFYSDVTSNVF